jgi:hypothetical protein
MIEDTGPGVKQAQGLLKGWKAPAWERWEGKSFTV